MGSLLSRPLCITIGLLYPAYSSFKALELPKTNDDKQWLTYWVVYTCTTSVETVADRTLSCSRVPGYYFIKILFLLWMMLPKTRGACLLYEYVILPLLRKYEPIMDEKFRLLQKLVTQYVKQYKLRAANMAKKGLQTLKDGNIRETLENLIDTTIKDIDNSNKDVISNKPDSP